MVSARHARPRDFRIWFRAGVSRAQGTIMGSFIAVAKTHGLLMRLIITNVLDTLWIIQALLSFGNTKSGGTLRAVL